MMMGIVMITMIDDFVQIMEGRGGIEYYKEGIRVCSTSAVATNISCQFAAVRRQRMSLVQSKYA